VDSLIVSGNTTSDVIWSFASKTAPSTLLFGVPIKRQYLPINRSEFINLLKIIITDQLGSLIDLD